jgi:hypothetical protein
MEQKEDIFSSAHDVEDISLDKISIMMSSMTVNGAILFPGSLDISKF